jgi:hypothetical protein
MSDQFIIRWVRHAESCANLLDKKIIDKLMDKDKADNHNKFIDRLVKEDEMNYIKEPFRTYINDANSKLTNVIDSRLEVNEAMINDCRSRNENDCWESTVMRYPHLPSAKAIFTREKMIKSSWLFTPTLSYVGTQQASQLGREEKFKSILGETKIIITSATVRTIMTAMLSLHSYFTDKLEPQPITIIVVPFINEHENVAGEFDLDNHNKGIPPDKILDIVKELKKWFGINENIFIDIEFYRNMCEKYDSLNPRVSNIANFRAHILPELKRLVVSRSMSIPIYILAYSHGYVIRNLLHDSKNIPPNVSIYEENNGNTQQIMQGVYIRQGFDDITIETNYETDKMKNICSLNSLRGNINQLLIGKKSQQRNKGGCRYKKKSKIKGKYNKRRSNKKTRM